MTVRKRDIFDAIEKGDPRLVRALALTGADLNEKTPGGRSVLQTAVSKGQADVVKVLTELGCDVHEKDADTGLNLLEWLLYTDWLQRHGILDNRLFFEKEAETALLLIKEGLEIGDNIFLATARIDMPGIFLQTEELIMNCHNLQAADEGKTVSTGYEFDI